jgi:thiol-disulfide isomerase/thioredoxin
MARSKIFAAWLPAAVLCLGIVGSGAWGQTGNQPGVGYNQGDTPPAWTLTDQHGAVVKSTDFAGKSVILVFSAAWCPPCVAAVPFAKEVQTWLNSNGEPTVVVDILLQDEYGNWADTADAKAWADRFGIEGPVLSCIGGSSSPAWSQFIAYSQKWGEALYPTVVVLSPHGRIINTTYGFATNVSAWLKKLLTEHWFWEPRSGIDWLLTDVERAKLADDLTKSLSAPLQTALQALDTGQPAVACAQLKAFVDLVLAQTGKGLNRAQATNLRGTARALQSQTGCQ